MIKWTAALLLSLLVLFGCSKKTAPSSSAATSYSEDLSVLHPFIPEPEEKIVAPGNIPSVERPVEALITQYDITNELDSIAILIAERNLQKRFIDGYTVQIYSGSNREAANRAHSDLQYMNLDVTSQIVYVQPNYRVKVGKFYSRLEANKVYSSIKEVFPDALLLPEKIPVE